MFDVFDPTNIICAMLGTQYCYVWDSILVYLNSIAYKLKFKILYLFYDVGKLSS